ncbi:MAG TPA: hypothetical protein VLV83_22565 [Acidobacteriota bacterium]|nr:hypothetical protein [Acidobacteriota bacterium]
MTTPDSTFAAALKVIAEDAVEAEDSHPTPQELRDYQARRLPQEQMERIREHLAICVQCADSVLRLAQPVRTSVLDRLRSLLWTPSLGYGAAALFLAAFLWVLYWGGQPAHPNVHIESLVPLSERGVPATGGEAQRPTLRIPDGADSVLFVLGLADTQGFDRYRLELFDLAYPASPIYVTEDIRRMPAGNVSLSLSSQSLAPGEYRFQLLGSSGDGWQPLAEYRFRLQGRASGQTRDGK